METKRRSFITIDCLKGTVGYKPIENCFVKI